MCVTALLVKQKADLRVCKLDACTRGPKCGPLSPLPHSCFGFTSYIESLRDYASPATWFARYRFN
jgi:hypothetical protein